ncbi:uncharacterized protein LOC129601304, partial [Paramacrobiotus metropolitanus]|uniref:uncharacterized protein LOC129601304 n=1 Tax=Paramacrobiotus metropolitanus TaxID=2943436 RepID=UPI0024464C2D
MFGTGELGSTPSPTNEVFDATNASRPSSADGFFTTPPKSDKENLGYQASALEYTAKKWIAATPPEKINDLDLLRARCHKLITQIVLADKIVDSAEGSLRNSEDTHKLERRKWERDMADANKGIATQQREIDRLNAILKRADLPCRYEDDQIAILTGMLERSTAAVFEIKKELDEAHKALEEAAGAFHQQLNQANEEAEVYRNEVDRYVVELKKADNEIDRLTQRTDELESEMELLLLADQVHGLNQVLKEEQKIRAQLEYNLNEARKVNEAQHSRIVYLEAREVELYDFGEQAARNLTEMMRQMDEMDTETRCLREEKKHLEQSQVELPPYREQSRAPRQNRAPPPQQHGGQPQRPRHEDQAQARYPQQDEYDSYDEEAYQQGAYEDQQGHVPYANPPPAPAAQQAAPVAYPIPPAQDPAHIALDNPNRRWFEDWHTRYQTGGPLGSANPNYALVVPPPRQRQQGGGSGGAGNGNRQTGPGNGSGGNRRNSGGGQQGSPERRQQLPPHQPFGLASPNNGPAR